MSYSESSNGDTAQHEGVMSRISYLSDGSLLEDLLAKLEDFPHVPDQVPLYAEMFPPAAIHQHDAENRISNKVSPNVASLVIDTTLGAMLDPLPSDQDGDATINPSLHTAPFSRAHPGLVMDHDDPPVTFKSAYPQRQQESPRHSPSPATPSLSNGSSGSSPLTPSMQTPPSDPFRGLRSASSLSREPLNAHVISRGLHRVARSSTPDSLNSVLRHNLPLRRTASEHSQRRPPPLASRSTSRQFHKVVPPLNLPMSSQPSSSTYSFAAEQLARRYAFHQASASPGLGDASSSPAVSDPPRSSGNSFMSSDEILAFRKFLTRRAADVRTEARDLDISPVPEYQTHSFREGGVSDSSEFGESTSSGSRRFSPHGLDELAGSDGHPAYHPRHHDTTSVSTGLDSSDGQSTKGDLLRVLGIVRAERERISSDDGSLPASGDAFLDLYPRSSSSASQLQTDSPIFYTSDASNPRYRIGPLSPFTNPLSPVTTTSTTLEETLDRLPDFLDLRPDVDPGSPTDAASPSWGGDPHVIRDDCLASVPEDLSDDFSRENVPMRLEGGGGHSDLVPGKQPLVRSLALRRVQSAAACVPESSRYTSSLCLSQSYSPSTDTRSDLRNGDLEGRRAYHRTALTSATTTEMTRGVDSYCRYDHLDEAPAEYAELAYGQSTAEPDNVPREDFKQRVHSPRPRDVRQSKPGLRVAVIDSSSTREFLSRETATVMKRPRAMTLQEVKVSSSSTPDRLRRSASATASEPSASYVHGGSRFRTLSDRAHRHPDVPHSPFFSEMDHSPLPQGASRTARSSGEHFDRTDAFQVSPPESGNATLPPRRWPDEGHSRNAYSISGPPRSRPHMALSHGRNGSCPTRPRPAQTQVRRFGSSPNLNHGVSSITKTLPSPFQGIGLSLVDNGAFEAPRPAPEPRIQSEDKASVFSSRTSPRGTSPSALKKLADNRSKSDSHLVVNALPTGFGLSFRFPAWTKKRKLPPRSDSLAGHLRSSSHSGSDSKSSLISIIGQDVKPQKKGLLFKKK